MNVLSRHNGGNWRFSYGNSVDGARYNLKGACVCAFIDYDSFDYEQNPDKYIKVNF